MELVKWKWQQYVMVLSFIAYMAVVYLYYSLAPFAGVLVLFVFMPGFIMLMFLIRSTMGNKTPWRRIYIHDRFPPWHKNTSYRPKWEEPPEKYKDICMDNNITKLPPGWIPAEGRWTFALRMKRNLERISIFPAGLIVCETANDTVNVRRPLHYRDLIDKDDSLILSPELFEYRRKHNIPEEMYKASKRAGKTSMGLVVPILIIMVAGVVIFITLRYMGVLV